MADCLEMRSHFPPYLGIELAAAAPSDLCRDIEPPPVLEERRTDKALQHRIGITVYERPESG